MKYMVQSSWELHVCDVDERANLDAFDIYFRWRVPAYDNQWREELLLKASGWLMGVDDDDGGFVRHCDYRIRYSWGSKKKLRLGPEQRRFEIGSVNSGGTMVWEAIRLMSFEAPHVFNCLRNHPRWDFEEWDTEFRAKIWESRRALDESALRKFGQRVVRTWIKGEAEKAGCTVEELLGAGNGA